ncbi:hypothetical protein AT6N2_C1538 [Agrobacterium tumefaciens]|nr:hypothetical protein AT6N2_C1538 [Agrobacterium tumefaciens]
MLRRKNLKLRLGFRTKESEAFQNFHGETHRCAAGCRDDAAVTDRFRLIAIQRFTTIRRIGLVRCQRIAGMGDIIKNARAAERTCRRADAGDQPVPVAKPVYQPAKIGSRALFPAETAGDDERIDVNGVERIIGCIRRYLQPAHGRYRPAIGRGINDLDAEIAARRRRKQRRLPVRKILSQCNGDPCHGRLRGSIRRWTACSACR